MRRIGVAVRWVERRMRNEAGHRARWHTPRGDNHRIWYFELGETLPQWSSTPVLAYRRVWDPSLNSGWGGFATDCDQSFQVADWGLVGVFGIAGANGWAEVRRSDNGNVGIIRGLVCPGECACGTDYSESPSCE